MQNTEENILEWILSSDSTDEENNNVLEIRERRPRKIWERINWFERLDIINFRRRCRLLKNQFTELLNKIEHQLLHDTERNNTIKPEIPLLLTLRFLATGSFIITMADFCGISKSSAHRIIDKVVVAIAELHEESIKVPSEAHIRVQAEMKNFYVAGFPLVLGAIDCIHVRIRSYGGDNSELFRNRKGFFSINVQAIVNSKLEIIDIVARWPGATHDATIFDNCRMKARF
ncbi:putative nuclease HARBI1 [Prorops nasuta]|uniref:putative nuclease HARBI1 n=1 Tax=Prorops nasuta TaxID=863751 RepID=UPI0034CDD43E